MSEEVNLDYLENNVFVGLNYNGVKVYLRQLVLGTNNIVNGVKEVVTIESDKLAPYMTVERREGENELAEISFYVPYSLVMSDEAISKFAKPKVDYELINLLVPELFSFGLILKINADGFMCKYEWLNDQLGLISTIFAAAFNFTKTEIKG